MQPVITLCHVVKPENGQYAYNYEIEKLLNPVAYVFITAPGEVVAKRVHERNILGARNSPEESAQEIERVQNIKVKAVRELANRQGAKLLVLHNITSCTELNVNALRTLVQSIA